VSANLNAQDNSGFNAANYISEILCPPISFYSNVGKLLKKVSNLGLGVNYLDLNLFVLD
jgi:hypothetical protein